MYGVLKISLFCQAAIYNDVLDDDEDGEDFNEEGNQEEDDDDDIDEEDGKITLKTATQKYFKPTTSKDNRVEVCHKVKPFTIREQKMLRVAPPKSKVQQRVNTKMKTNLRLWLSKLLMNFHKLTIGGCPFSKEHRWRFFSTVTYCQKSEVFMIIIMIGTTFLFCDMG